MLMLNIFAPYGHGYAKVLLTFTADVKYILSYILSYGFLHLLDVFIESFN